jgi:hypothetical protein
MSEDRRAALDAIGFNWDPLSTVWNEMFQRLVKYKEEHGDCNVPRGWKKDPSLGSWVGTQRAVYAELTSERRERLDALSFDWDVKETAWRQQYQKLIKYTEVHGNCNVPRGWEKNPSLGEWVASQRAKKAKLTGDRRTALDSLGFQWQRPRSWDDRYQRLVSYKKEYGNCRVPLEWETDRELGIWVGRQRQRRDALDDTQKNLLDEIGFDWNPRDTVWNEMYGRLVRYREAHGHCNVPRDWEDDVSLGNWVCFQRQYRSTLADAQHKDLKRIGFDWDPFETLWNVNYQRLQEFVNEHGHCRVIRDLNDTSFYDWVNTQRSLYTKGFLSPERITRLNELSFIWSTPREYDLITIKLEAQWKATYYGKLMAFKAAHGHCSVPTQWKDDRSLAIWVSLQRALNNRGDLRIDRKELLDQAGFSWSAKRKSKDRSS